MARDDGSLVPLLSRAAPAQRPARLFLAVEAKPPANAGGGKDAGKQPAAEPKKAAKTVGTRDGASVDSALSRINHVAFGFRAHRSRDVAVQSSRTFRVVERFHTAIGIITVVASATDKAARRKREKLERIEKP